MFDRLKRSISRSRHQSAVNELLSKLSKALAPRDLSKEVDITSNSHLQSFVESLNDRALVGAMGRGAVQCLADEALLSGRTWNSLWPFFGHLER